MRVTATMMVTCYLWGMAKISFLSAWISCLTWFMKCVLHAYPPQKMGILR